jgi:hypothetical protein
MTIWRTLAMPLLTLGLVGPFLMNCGANVPGVPALPGVPGGSCPGTDVEALAKFDFVKEWQLQADTGAKLKSGVIAAVELKGFADSVEADLKGACTGLASDLGKSGDYPNAEAACKAAISAMGEVKAKMGANAKLALTVKPPQCGASMDAMAKCAGDCDATVTGPKAKVECEPGKLQGECSGKCEGSCDMSASASCDGTCSGSCDATFSGSCGGNCNGKCDGKNATGSCTGKCEGKCDAHAEGSCGGKCSGSCKMKAKASCQGTCSGSCDVEMKAPKCTGKVTPPKMSAECDARCNAQVQAKVECTPAAVGLVIEGAADAKAAATYKAAIEKDLPAVLKVAIGMGEHAVHAAGEIKDVIGSVQSSVEASVKAGGASGALIAGKITACFGEKFKGALDGAASLKANVDVSVNVKASASASGSASGKAG